jgi:uncharacterized protein DUF3303
MLDMVIETFHADATPDIYRHLRDRGRQLPAGLEYIDSWVDLDDSRCFQLMRGDDRSLVDAWTRLWSDLVSFVVIPVRGSTEAARRIAADL